MVSGYNCCGLPLPHWDTVKASRKQGWMRTSPILVYFPRSETELLSWWLASQSVCLMVPRCSLSRCSSCRNQEASGLEPNQGRAGVRSVLIPHQGTESLAYQCQRVLSWEELSFLKLRLSYIFGIQIIFMIDVS